MPPDSAWQKVMQGGLDVLGVRNCGRRCSTRRPRKWKTRQRPWGAGDVARGAGSRPGGAVPRAGDGAGAGAALADPESGNHDKDPMEWPAGRMGPVHVEGEAGTAGAGGQAGGGGGTAGAGAALADPENGNHDKD